MTKVLDENADILGIVWNEYIDKLLWSLLRELPESETTEKYVKKYYKYLNGYSKFKVLTLLKYNWNSDLFNALLKDKISTILVHSAINWFKKDHNKTLVEWNIYLSKRSKDDYLVTVADIIGVNLNNISFSEYPIITDIYNDISKSLPKAIKEKLENFNELELYINSLSTLYFVFINENPSIDDFQKAKDEAIKLQELFWFEEFFDSYIKPIIQSSSISSLKLVSKLTKIFDKEGVSKIISKFKMKKTKINWLIFNFNIMK
jgi:hypothetical protein